MNEQQDLSYEQAYKQLEEVIAKLEQGDLSLDESVELYAQGRKLSAHCQQLLEKAELRIVQLAQDGSTEAM